MTGAQLTSGACPSTRYGSPFPMRHRGPRRKARLSLALRAHPSDHPSVARRARGTPDTPPLPPKRRDESVTARLDVTPEILASMLLDDSERPTVRMPARPPFATPDDEALAQRQKHTEVTVQK